MHWTVTSSWQSLLLCRQQQWLSSCGWSICVLLKLVCWHLAPRVKVMGDGGLWEVIGVHLGREGWCPRWSWYCYKNEETWTLCVCSYVNQGRSSEVMAWPCWQLTFGLWTSRTMRTKYLAKDGLSVGFCCSSLNRRKQGACLRWAFFTGDTVTHFLSG